MNEIVKTPYLRPNLENQGEVPPIGEIIYSPDICFAGMHPIANFQKVLIQEESYSQVIAGDAVSEVNNYVYLRCKNGAEKAVSIQAQLYIVPKNKSIFPEEWKALPVDNREENEGNTTNVIPLMQPGEIGVVEAPFVWKRPSSDNMGDYSLIARLFSDEFPNDKPQSSSVLKPSYMTDFLEKGLLWAQRNIAGMTFNPNRSFWNKDIPLNIPTDSIYKKSNWLIIIKSHKFDKWDIQIQASRTDENGNEIFKERIHIEPEFILGRYVMSPGFFTRLSLFLYPKTTDISIDSDAFVDLELYYGVPITEGVTNANLVMTIRAVKADEFKINKDE